MLKVLPYNRVNDSEVLIYGATIWGKLVYEYLIKMGIHVVAILDKNQVGKEIGDIVVDNPENISEYSFSNILICATRGFRSMCDYIEARGYNTVYHIGDLLDEVDWGSVRSWDAYDKDEMISKYIKYVDDYMGLNNDEIQLGEMNVIVTDLCNLKCDMCLARCPDIKNGKLYDIDSMLTSFSKILDQVECIYKIIICGGEPFVHPNLHELVDYCVKQSKIKRIEVLTNATIIPRNDNLQCLKDGKVRLVLDEYHLESQKIEKIKEICKENAISCNVKELEYWHDLSLLDCCGYSDEKLKKLYRECTESQNYTLVDNKFVNCYRCFVDRTCGDWDKEDYFIDLIKYNQGESRLKADMLHLMKKPYIERCKYCVGTAEKARPVPVAVQK